MEPLEASSAPVSRAKDCKSLFWYASSGSKPCPSYWYAKTNLRLVHWQRFSSQLWFQENHRPNFGSVCLFRKVGRLDSADQTWSRVALSGSLSSFLMVSQTSKNIGRESGVSRASMSSKARFLSSWNAPVPKGRYETDQRYCECIWDWRNSPLEPWSSESLTSRMHLWIMSKRTWIRRSNLFSANLKRSCCHNHKFQTVMVLVKVTDWLISQSPVSNRKRSSSAGHLV